MVTPAVRRHFVTTPVGQIHYAEAGDGPAVLFLHQTPRSWDEFRDVLPIVGADRRAIAMDTLGFGDSDPPAEYTIEAFASGVVALLDALDLPSAAIVGHHTGGVIAVEVAAAHPERVEGLVLSSTPLVDAAARERMASRPAIDGAEPHPDGTHLVQLWQNRMPWYPPDRPDLLHRLVIDCLKAADAEEGHHAVQRYRMEDRLPLVRARTLVVAGTEDPHAYPYLQPLAAAIDGATARELAGGMVPMDEHMPEEFAGIVLRFLLDSPIGAR